MLLAQRNLKPGSIPNGKLAPVAAPLGHIRETLPMPFILQPPEEQTDNWDDDFEEGISLSKLHGAGGITSCLGRGTNGHCLRLALDKPTTEDEKPEADDNARTIRPGRRQSGGPARHRTA